MATILDTREELLQVDTQNALASIEQLGSQIQHIYELAESLSFDPTYSNISNVVVAGMGGSAYGTHVIQTLFKNELKVPVTVVPDYTVPAYVNEQTLVIASSYSGSSEETLSAVEDAYKKGAKITGLTTGGKLAEFFQKHNLPSLIFEATYNPCGVARFAYGYSIFGQIALFAKLGLITLTKNDMQLVLETIAIEHLACSVGVSQNKNVAKLLAYECHERIPVIAAAEHLEGIAHVVANALNENAKTYSEFRVTPELDHHLLEGFEFPKASEDTLVFLTANSELYEKANQHRMNLTIELLEKFHLPQNDIDVLGKTRLQQAVSLLTIGIYVSYYLAILYDRDPAKTAQVDWFKNKLKTM